MGWKSICMLVFNKDKDNNNNFLLEKKKCFHYTLTFSMVIGCNETFIYSRWACGVIMFTLLV